MTIKDLLKEIFLVSWEKNYPDIHLNTHNKPLVRDTNGDIIVLNPDYPTLTKEAIAEIIKEVGWENGFDKFKTHMDLDVSYQYEDGNRYRVNCYMDTNGYSIAMRLIPEKIPNLEELGLWEQIKEMCNKSKWLILVTWPTGSGKSTNLAAMIDYINVNHNKHIITIEDPVEFSFKSKKSLINQREIWNSTKWFPEAIRASLREDPDIVMVWEMRDPETIKAAITLAETGHLVFSTLHTNDSVQTIDRIVDVFPSNQQAQIRMQLSQSLVWVVSQRLIPRTDKDGRIAAREIMLANDAVKNLILWWKTHQLYSVLEVSQKSGMILMDKYLLALYKKNIISAETLKSFSRDKDSIDMMIEWNQ